MDKLIQTVGKKAKLVAMILFFAATAFLIVISAAGFGGGFMPVVGNLFLFVFNLALIGSIPVLLVLKKYDLSYKVLAILFTYWIINGVFNYIGSADDAVSWNPSLVIAASIFEFFVGLCLIAVIVFALIYFFTKKRKFLQIGFCIFAASSFFFLMTWIMMICVGAKYNANWTFYFNAFYEYLFLPCGLIFMVLDYLFETTKIENNAETAEDNEVKMIESSDETDAQNEDAAVKAESESIDEQEDDGKYITEDDEIFFDTEDENN